MTNNAPCLNQDFTFDNFVEGNSNSFAYRAAKRVSEQVGQTYNPFVLYGGVGVGKTHLMHAIAHQTIYQDKHILYTTAEELMNEYIHQLNNRQMDQFKEKYRQYDLLLVDNIEFFCYKYQIQEEFFYLLESLFNSSKQVVLASNKHPLELNAINDHLKSKLQSGLIVEIQSHEVTTKAGMIQKKTAMMNLKLSSEIIHYLAMLEVNSMIMNGMLTKLYAYSELMKRELDIETVNTLIEYENPQNNEITIERIVETIARDLNIDAEEIISKSKKPRIVFARHIAIYLARQLTPNALPELASYFGLKDYMTIKRIIEKVKASYIHDNAYIEKIDYILDVLQAD